MILPCRNPVHLYRSLLREASYLFDPAAQTFHTDHIRWSFQRQWTKQTTSRVRSARDGSNIQVSQHDSKQLKRARQYLRTLQRANQGYLTAVKNILRMTYARKGKQRRALVKNIMIPPSATDPTAPPTPVKYDAIWRPPAKFSTLLENQNRVQSYVDRNSRKIKSMPKIPEKNRWNKPFPKSRVKGIMMKWYTRNADLLMPPLQEAQWMSLYQTATEGTTRAHFRSPKRRPIGTVGVLTEADHMSAEWTGKIDRLIQTSAQRPQHSRRIRAVLGNPHHMTTRFLRRMMQQAVLGSTSTTIADPSTGKLAVRWDPAVKPPPKPSTCTEFQQASLFD